MLVTHSKPEVICINYYFFLKRVKAFSIAIYSYLINIMARWIREEGNCVVMYIPNKELKRAEV